MKDRIQEFITRYEALIKEYPEIDGNFMMGHSKDGRVFISTDSCFVCTRDRLNKIIEMEGAKHLEAEMFDDLTLN